MMKLEDVLPAALGHLVQMQQDRLAPKQARRIIDGLRHAAPQLPVNLIWNQRPYDATIAYTLLVRDPERGTVALSFAPNGSLPWPLRTAQPWRERDVLRVNGVTLAVEQASAMIDALWTDSRLRQTLIDACLIEERLRTDPPAISDDDIEDAIDAFRRAHGLLEEWQTLEWLRDRGMTVAGLESLAERAASIRALRRQLASDRIDVEVAANGRQFDHADVALFEVAHDHEATSIRHRIEIGATEFFSAAIERFLERGQPRAQWLLRTVFGFECTPGEGDLLLSSKPASIVAPLHLEGRVWVARVLKAASHTVDPTAREACERWMFERWLATQREHAIVDWNWGSPGGEAR